MMSSAIEILVLATIGVAFLSVWFVIFSHGSSRKGKDEAAGGKSRSCPLCGSRLQAGENVKSFVFPGKPDRIMHVFGCPYCLPPSGSLKRICPACLREVPTDGYVIGRYFVGPGRKHLHVLGCTGCRDRSLDARQRG
jgi:hypothetical protein